MTHTTEQLEREGGKTGFKYSWTWASPPPDPPSQIPALLQGRLGRGFLAFSSSVVKKNLSPNLRNSPTTVSWQSCCTWSTLNNNLGMPPSCVICSTGGYVIKQPFPTPFSCAPLCHQDCKLSSLSYSPVPLGVAKAVANET